MTGARLLRIVFPGDRRWDARNAIGAINRLLRRVGSDKNSVPVTGLKPGVAVHYGECCHPLPGDRIVGIIRKGKGVILHTIDCPNLESYSDEERALGRCAMGCRSRFRCHVCGPPENRGPERAR